MTTRSGTGVDGGGARRAEAGTKASGKPTGGGSGKVSTPWGQARVVEEARVHQEAGEKRFSAVFQLLESPTGQVFVRVAYASDGVARRGPVTLRPSDLRRLQKAFGRTPGLAAALGAAGVAK